MTLGAIDNYDRMSKGRREMASNEERKASIASDRVRGKSSKRGVVVLVEAWRSRLNRGVRIGLRYTFLCRPRAGSKVYRTPDCGPFTSESFLKKEHSA